MSLTTVLIVQEAVRRYRESFYTELHRLLDERGIRLRLIESGRPDPESRGDQLVADWIEWVPSWTVRIAGREAVWQRVVGAAKQADLVVVEQGSRLLSNLALLGLQRLGGTPVAFWGHGRSFSDDASGAAERLKVATSRRVHWWFAYNQQTVGIISQLGYPVERMTDVRNSTDTTRLRAALRATDHQTARRQLGLGSGPIGLTLGALTTNKGLHMLFAAADEVRDAIPDFELLIVGDGNERAMVEAEVARRPWAHHRPPVYGTGLAQILAASTVMLTPAAAGLVVVDALAAGLPMVTCRDADHGPEISYLRPDVDAIVVDDAQDVAGYARSVIRVLKDADLYAWLAGNAAEQGSTFGTEQMARRFADGLVEALA